MLFISLLYSSINWQLGGASYLQYYLSIALKMNFKGQL